MGVLWFSAFVLLSLLMRKLRFPNKISVAPMLLLLILSLFRMVFPVDVGAVLVLSGIVFPTIIEFLRIEFAQQWLFGFPFNMLSVLILIWILVSVVLLIDLVMRTSRKYWAVISLTVYPRDGDAEALLTEMVNPVKPVRVFRVSAIKVPMAVGMRPYICLPDVDFTVEELKVILKHEWKHYQDKDYYTNFIINVTCAIFWWHPLVYLLKRNLSFALEMKCDNFAVLTDADFEQYMNAAERLSDSLDAGFVIDRKELVSRAAMLESCGVSRRKRTLVNVFFCAILSALFIFSYTFQIQPAFWESDVEAVDYFSSELYEVYRAEENFIVCNDDGTFSVYIGGQLVSIITELTPAHSFLPIRQRGEE